MKLTTAEIEERLELAALTLKRMPNPTGSGPKGYGSSWPDVVKSRFTAYGSDQARVRVIPSAEEIQMMEDAFEWLNFVHNADDRRIVWMRADGFRWRPICNRVGLSRSQTHRRWAAAILTIQKRLVRGKRKAPAK